MKIYTSSSNMLDSRRWDPSLSKLLVTLEESRDNLPTGPTGNEEIAFLSDLLQSSSLHALVQVHNTIIEKDDQFIPVVSNSFQINEDVLEVLSQSAHENPENPECLECLELLQSPHFQGLFYSHDIVGQKDYLPKLPDILPDEYPPDDYEETIKIVQLVKSNEPLDGIKTCEPIVGATIKKDEETGKIVIARVMHGGAADRSGLIFPGDEVIEVNCLSVEGKTPDDVLQILKNSEGTITFKLVPADGKMSKRESKVRVRCLFNFNPHDDPHIPCKEAGLDFQQGDILHIVSQDDVYWWQARREGDKSMRAGLIPSRALQERRVLMARTTKETNHDEANDCSPCKGNNSPLNSLSKASKKIAYDLTENEDFDRDEIPTYEEVSKLYPRKGFYRPIVLIGPPGVGRNELKRRLIDLDPKKYKTTVPFTSRTARPGEQNRKDYNFVSREKMEDDIQNGRFIEFGEYKANLYGTSSQNVRDLLIGGFAAILNPHSQALKMLRTAEFKPYIIFVKAPQFEVLKRSRHTALAKSTFDEYNSRAFNDDEFNEIIKSGERLEYLYGHMFDEILINDDLSKTFERLVKIVKKVEQEPHWVKQEWAN